MRIQLALLLFVILFSCSPNKVENEAMHDECDGAIKDKAILLLANDNKHLIAKNYTGILSGKFSEDSTRTKFLIYYEKGEIINYESFYFNGNLQSLKPIKCNSANGLLEYYTEDGNIEFILDMALGKKHGEAISYYSNGEKRQERNFTNDTLDGYQYEFTENGDTLRVEKFKMGIKIMQP